MERVGRTADRLRRKAGKAAWRTSPAAGRGGGAGRHRQCRRMRQLLGEIEAEENRLLAQRVSRTARRCAVDGQLVLSGGAVPACCWRS
jgi:hypothetical protein